MRAATDIVALIGEHAALKRVGRRWTGLCPFHTEKSPSFSVNAEEGFYYCFGCQASGDAITFVRATEHLDFVDAVRLLADRAGVALHEDAEAGKDRKRRTDLLDALERAVVWYHERLLRAPDAGLARDYLRSRGYDGEVVRQFRLGWAPDEWDALSRALKLPERVLTDSGLGFINRRGRAQDAFRGRVLFPICDPSGRPVALGGGSSRPGPASRPPSAPSPSTRTPRRRRSTRSGAPSMRSTGPSTTSSRRVRSWCARATPTSSASSRPACPGPWPPAGRPWPRSISPCCGTSAAASCWPTTPTGPARAPRPASTNGSASTRSTWSWPTCPKGAIRATSPAATPPRWPEPWPRPDRSCSSGWTAFWAGAT